MTFYLHLDAWHIGTQRIGVGENVMPLSGLGGATQETWYPMARKSAATSF